MKKAGLIFAGIILSGGIAAYAQAADEFGERFGGTAPAALQEDSPQGTQAAVETAPQDIEPAAGDEAAPPPAVADPAAAADPEAAADETEAAPLAPEDNPAALPLNP